MAFYRDLKEAIEKKENELVWICQFLNKENGSDEVFIDGNMEEVKDAIEVILSIPLHKFFDAYEYIDLNYEIDPADVPQFSNLEHGLVRVPELLEFAEDGLTYYEIGYQIMKAVKVGACVKYGENHSKLAEIFSLVNISNTRPAVVTTTPLGSYLVGVTYDEKTDLLRRLLMRDRFMKKILNEAKDGFVEYTDVVSCLSPSTALRRRSNVKRLTEFVLVHTEYESYFRNISW